MIIITGKTTKPVRTLEGTGTCSCCGRNIKLTRTGKIIKHGKSADCSGTGYLPWELSPAGLRAMIRRIEAENVCMDGMSYKHNKTGKIYNTICIGNQNATKANWPVSIAYKDAETGEVWIRPLDEFLERNTKIGGVSVIEHKERLATWTEKALPGTNHDY